MYHNNSINNAYGAFEDLTEFRKEMQLSPDEMSDNDAYKLMHEDNKTHIQMLEKEKEQLLDKQVNIKSHAVSDINKINNMKDMYQAELELERNRRKLCEQLYNASNNKLYIQNELLDLNDAKQIARYLEKERLKNEIRHELLKENPLTNTTILVKKQSSVRKKPTKTKKTSTKMVKKMKKTKQSKKIT